MAGGYKISDKSIKNVWLVISKDSFLREENLRIVENICAKNGISSDSVSHFSAEKTDWDEVSDLILTPSFFGERLIVISGDISDINDDGISQLTSMAESCYGNHLAIVLTYEDDKKIKAKKYEKLFETAQNNGVFFHVADMDEKYLSDMIISHAKKQGTVLDKIIARKIVDNVGRDAGLLINEVDKYCAACDYTEITGEIVDALGVKTVEASVFDMIDLICRKRPVKAIDKLNNLFDLRADEISILGAMTSGFVDMHRCKLAQAAKMGYIQVNKDFEKNAKPYRYQKAMNNASNFSLGALEEILQLLLKADISIKTGSVDKKQILYVLTTQIIAKGIR